MMCSGDDVRGDEPLIPEGEGDGDGQGRIHDMDPRALRLRTQDLSRRAHRAGHRLGIFGPIRFPLLLALFLGCYLGWVHAVKWGYRVGAGSAVLLLAAVCLEGRARRRRAEALLGIDRAVRALGRIEGTAEGGPAPVIPECPLSGVDAGERVYAPEGKAFALDPDTVQDLEILRGAPTLFGRLDATFTPFGAKRLAYILTHPLARAGEIRARQDAVREIAGDPEMRERMARVFQFMAHPSLGRLPSLLRDPPSFEWGRLGRAWIVLWGSVAPMLFVGTLVWHDLGWSFLFALMVNLITVSATSSWVNPTCEDLLLLLRPLRGAVSLKRSLSARAWASAELVALRGFFSELRSPERGRGLTRIRRVLLILELRGRGILYEVFNALLLWELRTVPSAVRRVSIWREELEALLGALGEVEALLSMAAFAAEKGDMNFPDVKEEERPVLEIEDGRHPLIERDRAVPNTLLLGRHRQVSMLIVTGPNASGRSTVLKMAALHLLLAQAGGPVPARRMRLTPMAPFAVLHRRDSLGSGKGSLEAEGERILRIFDAGRASPFFFAVLEGLVPMANAGERAAVSAAVLRGLRRRGGIVLVATDDPSIARLEGDGLEHRSLDYGPDEVFDHCLVDGPWSGGNVIRVLAELGLPGDVVEEARREPEVERPPR